MTPAPTPHPSLNRVYSLHCPAGPCSSQCRAGTGDQRGSPAGQLSLLGRHEGPQPGTQGHRQDRPGGAAGQVCGPQPLPGQGSTGCWGGAPHSGETRKQASRHGGAATIPCAPGLRPCQGAACARVFEPWPQQGGPPRLPARAGPGQQQPTEGTALELRGPDWGRTKEGDAVQRLVATLGSLAGSLRPRAILPAHPCPPP